MRVLIIGAGGHAQVVADVLLRMQEKSAPVELVGYLDDDPALASTIGASFVSEFLICWVQPSESLEF
jgi:FlaA1/EpsC-like NDP-sugar epimerase